MEEIFIGSRTDNDPTLLEFDPINQQVVNFYTFPEPSVNSYVTETRFSNLIPFDIDGDNEQEIIASSVRIHFINPETGESKWSSERFSNIYKMRIGNVDSDEQPEIVFTTHAPDLYGFTDLSRIYVIDSKTKEIIQSDFGTYLGLDLIDSGNGYKNILVGDVSGAIQEINGSDFSIIQEFSVSNNPIMGVELYDFNKDDTSEIIFGDLASVGVLDRSGNVIWRDYNSAGYTGAFNNISVTDLDGDNLEDIIVGSYHSVFTYELHPFGPPPQVTDDKVTINEDESIQIDVLANDISPIGGPLTLVGLSNPELGDAEIIDNEVFYTPNSNAFGNDTFEYEVANKEGSVSVGTIQIEIKSVNDLPAQVEIKEPNTNTIEIKGIASQLLNFSWTSSKDPDGDKLTYRLSFYIDKNQLITIYETNDIELSLSFAEIAEMLDEQNIQIGHQLEMSMQVTVSDGTVETEPTSKKITFTRGKLQGENWEIPLENTLNQNYPNPFNGSTSIRYGIQESGNIKLIIYDILGRKVKSLFSGFREAGWYQEQISSNKFASGQYIYILVTDNDMIVKKFMIIK